MAQDMSINAYMDLVNETLAGEGEVRASYATVQHYYLRGSTPAAVVDAVLASRALIRSGALAA